MKKQICALIAGTLLISTNCSDDNETTTPTLPSVNDIETVIKDSDFKTYLKTIAPQYDKDGDGKLSSEEVKGIKSLTFGMVMDEEEEIIEAPTSDYDVKSLTGIEYFSGLENLIIKGLYISAVDLKHNTQLKKLSVVHTGLTALDLSANKALTTLRMMSNQKMDALTMGEKPELAEVEIIASLTGNVPELDFSSYKKLEIVELNSLPFTTKINLSNCPALEELEILYAITLNSIDVSGCTRLKHIYGYNVGKLTKLNVTNCSELNWIELSDTSLETLDLSGSPKLESIECIHMKELKTVDLSKSMSLKTVSISSLLNFTVYTHPTFNKDNLEEFFISSLGTITVKP